MGAGEASLVAGREELDAVLFRSQVSLSKRPPSSVAKSASGQT